MKKAFILGGLVFFVILFTYTNICYGLSATFSSSKTSVATDEEVTLTIRFDKKVVAANFNINYDSSVFGFVEGVNINAAEKNGKIACIYADATLNGTEAFSIKFKALKESSSTNFDIDDVKVRELGQDESVTKSEIAGLSSVMVEVKNDISNPNQDPTPSTDKPTKVEDTGSSSTSTTAQKTTTGSSNNSIKSLPAAGLESKFIILISIVVVTAIAIISKKKFNNFKKIFSIVLFMGMGMLVINNAEVHAAETSKAIITKIYNETLESHTEKVIAIMLEQNSSNLNISVSEFKSLVQQQLDLTIESVNKVDNTELNSSDKVNTGAKAKVGEEEYRVLIYGDANGDGDICDADDLMVIINDYLGRNTVTDHVYKHAADLANKDNEYTLDSDDLIQMINMYLGKLKGSLVQELPENQLDIVLKINDSSNLLNGGGSYWNYTIYKDGTVKGEEWSSGSVIGFVSSKIKEYTVNLSDDEVDFLKHLDNQYTDNESSDEYFYSLSLENFNGHINIPKLNNEAKEELKSILEKIFEFRDTIIIESLSKNRMSEWEYIHNDNHSEEDKIYDISYYLDIHEKKVGYIYTKKIPYDIIETHNHALEEMEYAEKELSDQQIEEIKNLFRKIENNYDDYTEEKFNEYCSNNNLDDYYIMMYLDNRMYSKINDDMYAHIYKEEEINKLNSILSIDESDILKATVENNKSSSNSMICLSDYDVDISEKGYDIIETDDKYYLVIAMGESQSNDYKLQVNNIRINEDKNIIDIEEIKPEDESNSEANEEKNYPYCIIEFNKMENSIEVNEITNIEYNELSMSRIAPIIHVDKPVIYLYPQEETNIRVKAGNPERFTCTYPKYEDEWNVIAKPNGDLIDIKTNRNLYCLYWEGINTVKPKTEEGFVVKGEDSAKFLEEKLKILGLNEREANEFIIYWLPQLEANKYNFIRFQTEEEINSNMPLEITPKPDTVIRIMMEWKALDEKIEIKEQKLENKERKGYTMVEWGGTKIK